MVSKLPSALVFSICLFSIISNVVPTNPDSEIVQDPRNNAKSIVKKSAEVLNAESRSSFAMISDRYSGYKILRPYYTDTGIIWRELLTSPGETIRIRDRGTFLDISRINRNNRNKPYEIPSTQRPGNYRPNVNGPDRGNNGISPYGYIPNGKVPNGNTPDNELNKTSTHEGNGRPAPPGNNQSNLGGTPPGTTDSGRISPDANLFATIVNDFAFKMVKAMKIDSNFVVSPLSIFVALSMCYLGAGGITKAQMEQSLGLNDYAVHEEHLHRGISDLLSMISPKSTEYRLFVANGLFFGKNFTVEESFKEDVLRFYSAELKNLDFSNQLATLNSINEWVAKKTMDAIPTLIDSPLPAQTRLVLLNAIFFKGLWKIPFPQDATYNGNFFNMDGTEEKAPFMNMYRGTFAFHRSEEHKHFFIRLPYQGDQVSMIIALPFERQGVPMSSMTDQILCHIRDAMKEVQLGVISVPRFRIEYLKSLREPLEQMGLNNLFGQSVNLTLMRKKNDVSVSEILHKAIIDVHEKGTTASASTDVQLVPLSGQGESFVANHPFAFYVVHDASGLVLFHGKVLNIGDATPSFVKLNLLNNRNDGSVPLGNRNDGNVPLDNGNDGNIPLSNRNGGNVPLGNRNDGNVPLGNRNDGNVPLDNRNEGYVPLGNRNKGISSPHGNRWDPSTGKRRV